MLAGRDLTLPCQEPRSCERDGIFSYSAESKAVAWDQLPGFQPRHSRAGGNDENLRQPTVAFGNLSEQDRILTNTKRAGSGHVFDNGKCSRKITSRSAHSTCSPRANRVDIPMPDGL